MKESCLEETAKLLQEAQEYSKVHEALTAEKEEKISHSNQLEEEIKEMKAIIAGLSMVKKGLNKYVAESR